MTGRKMVVSRPSGKRERDGKFRGRQARSFVADELSATRYRFGMKFLPLIAAALAPLLLCAAEAPKPLKALLFTGGCCHDYAVQKDLLKAGLESRANILVEQIHTPDKGTKYKFPQYEKPNWALGYDVVIHDECTADVKEIPFVESILAEHKRGVPAVNLHCAMHCYRTGTPIWFEFLGLHSTGHGPQLPIALTFLPVNHPITKGMSNWTTINEELYNNVKVWDEATPLVRGKQGAGDKPGSNDAVVAWTHLYGEKKTRVFSTTLGHNNETVADTRYLDLITRGLLWACDKIGDDGAAKEGYGPKK